jgi:hypothetical protein
VRLRLPARAEQPSPGHVRVRQFPDAERGGRADPHLLDVAVVDDRDRLQAGHRVQRDQPAEGAAGGEREQSPPADPAVQHFDAGHIRGDAQGPYPACGVAALLGLEPEAEAGMAGVFGREVGVVAWAVGGLPLGEFPVGRFEGGHALLGVKHALNVAVADDAH